MGFGLSGIGLHGFWPRWHWPKCLVTKVGFGPSGVGLSGFGRNAFGLYKWQSPIDCFGSVVCPCFHGLYCHDNVYLVQNNDNHDNAAIL